MQIEIISGSPRAQSLTHRVAIHLFDRLASDRSLNAGLISLNEIELPFVQQVWTGAQAAPEEFRPLAQRMFAADGFITVTPEYNGAPSPALRNLFDHFPKQYKKAFGICTASDGVMGGLRASQQMLLAVPALFGVASPVMLVVPEVHRKFSADGALTLPAFQKNIDNFVAEFLWLARAVTTAKK